MPRRRADPFAHLLDVMDGRAKKAMPTEAQMGTMTGEDPTEVTLDTGQVVTRPVVLGSWVLGDRVFCIPFQGGHDWAVTTGAAGGEACEASAAYFGSAPGTSLNTGSGLTELWNCSGFTLQDNYIIPPIDGVYQMSVNGQGTWSPPASSDALAVGIQSAKPGFLSSGVSRNTLFGALGQTISFPVQAGPGLPVYAEVLGSSPATPELFLYVGLALVHCNCDYVGPCG